VGQGQAVYEHLVQRKLLDVFYPNKKGMNRPTNHFLLSVYSLNLQLKIRYSHSVFVSALSVQ
jgi:hypothetical protein